MPDDRIRERIQQEVVSPNKDRLYQATHLERVKNIYKDSKGLDNISEEDMKVFKEFMLS
jgi:hypothetical protein